MSGEGALCSIVVSMVGELCVSQVGKSGIIVVALEITISNSW